MGVTENGLLRRIFGQVLGSCECVNELSSFIKCWEFSDWLRTCYFMKKDCAPCS